MKSTCRFADDVLIDAPFKISDEMIKTLGISLVVHGMSYENNNGDDDDGQEEEEDHDDDGTESDASSASSSAGNEYPNDYSVPQRLGIFKEIPSPSPLTAGEIMARINAHRSRYERK